ncbi:hypothetical protein D1007_44446 [Hordeum vulgare]|nr:hypothetical protein D1007_44446 [Hordeum vulgare]
MPADMLSGARNLFDRMPAADDDERKNRFMRSIIFEGDTAAAGGATTVDLDLDDFPLDHEFSKDYDLEEEDELDIEGSLCSRTSSPTKPPG